MQTCVAGKKRKAAVGPVANLAKACLSTILEGTAASCYCLSHHTDLPYLSLYQVKVHALVCVKHLCFQKRWRILLVCFLYVSFHCRSSIGMYRALVFPRTLATTPGVLIVRVAILQRCPYSYQVDLLHRLSSLVLLVLSNCAAKRTSDPLADGHLTSLT